jgi:hypothetical protein
VLQTALADEAPGADGIEKDVDLHRLIISRLGHCVEGALSR